MEQDEAGGARVAEAQRETAQAGAPGVGTYVVEAQFLDVARRWYRVAAESEDAAVEAVINGDAEPYREQLEDRVNRTARARRSPN